MKHLAKGTAAWALCAALLFSLFCPAAAQSADSPLDRAASYDGEKIREETLRKFGADTVCGLLIRACEDAVKAGRGGKA